MIETIKQVICQIFYSKIGYFLLGVFCILYGLKNGKNYKFWNLAVEDSKWRIHFSTYIRALIFIALGLVMVLKSIWKQFL